MYMKIMFRLIFEYMCQVSWNMFYFSEGRKGQNSFATGIKLTSQEHHCQAVST